MRAVTSVVNRDSIAFHQRLGFILLPGDFEVDGLPASGEPSVPEGAVVRFELRLDMVVTGSATVWRPRPRRAAVTDGASSRLSAAAALELLEHGDLLELGAAADEVRRRLHPTDDVTFVVDRNINYTDYCVSGCRFCAFYKEPGSGAGYLLSRDEIFRKIEETLALGGTAIMMQGGCRPTSTSAGSSGSSPTSRSATPFTSTVCRRPRWPTSPPRAA